ncbi:hypothetical protein NC652_029529 [Populus alba x Populus x berolinensis]|nr:hypothetical protein NC652_029529 [Populus alba x Populus x berolinensis]
MMTTQIASFLLRKWIHTLGRKSALKKGKTGKENIIRTSVFCLFPCRCCDLHVHVHPGLSNIQPRNMTF